MTYKQFIKFAYENYQDGGIRIIESLNGEWNKNYFDNYCKLFGKMTKEEALKLFRLPN